MVVVKLIMNASADENYLENTLKYIEYDKDRIGFNKDTCELVYNIRNDFVCKHGYGVNYYDYKMAFKQMQQIKHYFCKRDNVDNYKPMVHLVVSFDKDDDLDDCKRCCYHLEKWIGDVKGYQNVWGIHRTLYKSRKYGCMLETYHAHFVINNTSYMTGNAFECNRSALCAIINQINLVMGRYCEGWVDNQSTHKLIRLCWKK